MKRLCLLTITMLFLMGSSFASSKIFTTSHAAAIKKAQTEHKPIMAFFTGSDWCGWCVKLDREVFSKSEFANWAKKEVVALELDFPSRKKLSSAIKKQNGALKSKYGIRGYPTVVFIDPHTENEIGRTGYLKGGPGNWVNNAKKIVAKMPPPPSLATVEDIKGAKESSKKILIVMSSQTDSSTKRIDKLVEARELAESLQGEVVALKVHQKSGIPDDVKEALGDKLDKAKFGGYFLLDTDLKLIKNGRLPSTGKSMASTISRALK